MPETKVSRSPLARLVLFICCLAIAASIFAAAHYLVIDLPAQKDAKVPDNAVSSKMGCEICTNNCKIDPDYYACLAICNDLECSGTAG